MKKIILIIFVITSIFANSCNKKLFTIHLKNSVKFSEILSDVSNECNLNIVIKDKKSASIINSDINFVNVENVTLKELLDTLFDIKNLFYKIENNKLYIFYIKQKHSNLILFQIL
jgi:general secretion pathway protein D